MKKTEEKGVTLIVLVLTIIILLILTSIGATSGISTIQSAKFTKFQNELKIMQNKINELNTEGDTSIGKPLTQQQEGILEQSEVSNIIFKNKTDEQIEEIKNGFVYLDADTILNELGLEGIDNEYLVNIEHRYSVCSEGYQYDGKTYYMTEQLENGLYNVEYNDQNSKSGNYEVNYTQENKAFKIDIVNIEYDGYISKWDVKYKKQGSSNWKTAPGTTFYINDTGTFIINVSNGDINLGDKEITLESSVEITGINKEESDPKAAMPTGATVIEGNADEGIVIRDENGNEWVWVEVPKTADVYSTTTLSSIVDVDNITDDQCTTIYNDLATYASAYRQDGYEDAFYSTDQAGFTDATAYNTAKNNMLRSVYKNGGFWIGRYEVGIENSYRNYGDDYESEHPITETPVIKANVYPYNYVRCNQAQILSKQLSTGGKTSSLMFGIQWDLTCKFLEKSGLTTSQINSDSSSWGNYNNSTIILSRGKYNTSPYNITGQWIDITQGVKNMQMLLTTGASEDTNKMNIYDFAGNVWEWTLEGFVNNTDANCIIRGCGYNDDGNRLPASYRNNYNTIYSRNNLGFRSTLY